MKLPLTPETLARAYDYLCSTPPFNKWNLPDAEDVVFKVVRSPQLRGWYRKEGRHHVIAISSRCTGTTDSLMKVMAHEMVHLHQGDVRIETPGAQHNAAFTKIGDRVAAVHGFDPKLF